MILVGMLGSALVPIADLGLQGTVFEEGVARLRRLRRVLGGLGGVAYWVPKLWGRTVPDEPAIGLAAARRRSPPCSPSVPYFIAGFADQPAASADVRLRRPGRAVERRCHSSATA